MDGDVLQVIIGILFLTSCEHWPLSGTFQKGQRPSLSTVLLDVKQCLYDSSEMLADAEAKLDACKSYAKSRDNNNIYNKNKSPSIIRMLNKA